jgi:hypothetical protein
VVEGNWAVRRDNPFVGQMFEKGIVITILLEKSPAKGVYAEENNRVIFFRPAAKHSRRQQRHFATGQQVFDGLWNVRETT